MQRSPKQMSAVQFRRCECSAAALPSDGAQQATTRKQDMVLKSLSLERLRADQHHQIQPPKYDSNTFCTEEVPP